MKKILTLIAAAILTVSSVFAQSAADPTAVGADPYVDTSTIVRVIEDKYADFHPTASKVELSLEYTPLTGEVKVFYTCMGASYDQGEAMNTVDAILEDFSIENHFTRRPVFVKKDSTRYVKSGRDLTTATYRRWVRYDNR